MSFSLRNQHLHDLFIQLTIWPLLLTSQLCWSQTMDHSMHPSMNQSMQPSMHPSMHQHHQMSVDENGLVMNNNTDTLPDDCHQLEPDVVFTVTASTDYAKDYPGDVFGLSQHEFKVEPCSRITVTFINKDQIRHQWMVHGLPKYLYPQGMFHLEAAGGQQRTGTFIVPGDDKTYLVHCDMAQHMEKGMKAQLVVGKGDGNLWSVPGISGSFKGVNYQATQKPITQKMLWLIAVSAIAGLLAAGFYLRR